MVGEQARQAGVGTGVDTGVDADLVILGEVLTMDPERLIIPDGAVAVLGEKIVAVGPASEVLTQAKGAAVTGSRDDLVVPGYINGHQHLTGDRLIQSSIPDSLAPGESIFSWVLPVHAVHSPDDDELSATLTLAESLRNGVTSTFEAGTVAHPLRVAAAAEKLGARLTIGTWGWDVKDGPYTGTVDEVIGRQRDLLSRINGPLVSSWVSLVGHDLMSDELAVAASGLARDQDTKLTFHISPSPGDVESYLTRTGVRPLVHLERLGVLGRHCVLAHAVHLDDQEVELILTSGSTVVSCPWAYLRLGQGISREFRHLQIWQGGGRLALGCDSENAGDSVDGLRVAALFTGLAKDCALDPTVFGTHEGLELLTIKGAEALGVSDRVGSIEVGKQADLVVHDRSGVSWPPHGLDPVLQLVWGNDGRSVRDVLVAGRTVVHNGVVVGLDLPSITSEAASASRDLIARSGIRPTSQWPKLS